MTVSTRPIHDHSHDDDIARLHAEGLGRNAICRKLGLSFGTVTYTARRLGLSFDGSGVLMAVEARRREAADRRAELSLALLDDVERLRERMFSSMTYVQYGGKDFDRVEDTVEEPNPMDQASLARAAATLLDRAVKLDEYDRMGAGLDDARTFLRDTIVTIRGETVPELGSGEDDRQPDRAEP